MEILQLAPADFGVPVAGIYVIDDDGEDVLAGPFGSESDALLWIARTHTVRTTAARVRH